jgi:single-strand DNA-binding protein
MAFSLNRIQLIGNLGKDSETRFTPNNMAVTNFALATTYGYKGKDGNWVNETTWHNITAWNLSDFMKEHLKKGKKFYVEGRLTKREYMDKENIKRYAIDVVADKIIPLESSFSQQQAGMEEQMNSPAVKELQVEENDDLPF